MIACTGMDHSGPESSSSNTQSRITANNTSPAHTPGDVNSPQHQPGSHRVPHHVALEAADEVSELPQRSSKSALGSFVGKLFRSSTQPTAPRTQHVGMRPGKRRAASDTGAQPQPFLSPFAAIQQRPSDPGGGPEPTPAPHSGAPASGQAVEQCLQPADGKGADATNSSVDEAGDGEIRSTAFRAASSQGSHTSRRGSSPEPPSTPTQIPPSSRATAPASPCSTPGQGSAAATAAGTPRQTAAANETFTPDPPVSSATSPGGLHVTPLPVSFGGRPLQDGMSTPLPDADASVTGDGIAQKHPAAGAEAGEGGPGDQRVEHLEQKQQQQQHKRFQPRKSEGNFLMEHFLSPADWFRIKRRQTDAGLGPDHLSSPSKHHPRDFEAASQALNG